MKRALVEGAAWCGERETVGEVGMGARQGRGVGARVMGQGRRERIHHNA